MAGHQNEGEDQVDGWVRLTEKRNDSDDNFDWHNNHDDNNDKDQLIAQESTVTTHYQYQTFAASYGSSRLSYPFPF